MDNGLNLNEVKMEEKYYIEINQCFFGGSEYHLSDDMERQRKNLINMVPPIKIWERNGPGDHDEYLNEHLVEQKDGTWEVPLSGHSINIIDNVGNKFNFPCIFFTFSKKREKVEIPDGTNPLYDVSISSF